LSLTLVSLTIIAPHCPCTAGWNFKQTRDAILPHQPFLSYNLFRALNQLLISDYYFKPLSYHIQHHTNNPNPTGSRIMPPKKAAAASKRKASETSKDEPKAKKAKTTSTSEVSVASKTTTVNRHLSVLIFNSNL
jgi:hypothetical protein